MQVAESLIQQFLAGTCTPEERVVVLAAFREHPELYAQYLTGEHWEAFQPNERTTVPSDKMLQYLQAHQAAARVRRMQPAWMAAAAAVAILAVATFAYRAQKPATPAIAVAVRQAAAVPVPPVPQTTLTNNDNAAKQFLLADGSTVNLGAHSSITFNTVFTGRRDIYLQGEGRFNVAKDAHRPFTVHAGNVATTALGTVFSVNEHNGGNTIVHLYSGKVVVKKEPGVAGNMADVYLAPGQQLEFNKHTMIAHVSAPPAAALLAKNDAAPSTEPVSFTKEALPVILAKLQQAYKVRITYNKTALQNIDFTGSFDPGKTTVESFLETLCTLNDLALSKTKNGAFSVRTR